MPQRARTFQVNCCCLKVLKELICVFLLFFWLVSQLIKIIIVMSINYSLTLTPHELQLMNLMNFFGGKKSQISWKLQISFYFYFTLLHHIYTNLS